MKGIRFGYVHIEIERSICVWARILRNGYGHYELTHILHSIREVNASLRVLTAKFGLGKLRI